MLASGSIFTDILKHRGHQAVPSSPPAALRPAWPDQAESGMGVEITKVARLSLMSNNL